MDAAVRMLAPGASLDGGDDAGKRLQRRIWHFGIDWLCQAVGATGVGAMVVRRATDDHRIVGQLGCAALGRAALLHGLSESHRSRSRSPTVSGWARLEHAKETAACDAEAAMGERWTCQMPDVGDLMVFMGVAMRQPQTPESLYRLAEHVSRLGQALAAELCPRARASAKTHPVDMAMDAVDGLELTCAEKEVLRDLLTGTPAKRIATRRDVSVSTVRTQIKSIYGKLNVSKASQIYGRIQQPQTIRS